MQKLSQARSELRLAAGSDKGIQKLQFLKVRRHTAVVGMRGRRGEGAKRVEFSHRLRPTSSTGLLCASLHAPPVKDSGNATATARKGRKGTRGTEGVVENRRADSSLFSYSNIDPDIYHYENVPRRPLDVREEEALARNSLLPFAMLRGLKNYASEALWFLGNQAVSTDSLNGPISRRFNRELEHRRNELRLIEREKRFRL